MEVGDGEFSANILFLIVFFHVVLLFITLLICLWQGEVLFDSIFMGQIFIASMCLLFFIPVLSIYKKEFLSADMNILLAIYYPCYFEMLLKERLHE